jgi:hypothetical protein
MPRPDRIRCALHGTLTTPTHACMGRGVDRDCVLMFEECSGSCASLALLRAVEPNTPSAAQEAGHLSDCKPNRGHVPLFRMFAQQATPTCGPRRSHGCSDAVWSCCKCASSHLPTLLNPRKPFARLCACPMHSGAPKPKGAARATRLRDVLTSCAVSPHIRLAAIALQPNAAPWRRWCLLFPGDIASHRPRFLHH